MYGQRAVMNIEHGGAPIHMGIFDLETVANKREAHCLTHSFAVADLSCQCSQK